MPEPIAVPVGPCRCPGAPHGDGDSVYLRPTLGLTGGLAVEAAMADPNSTLAVSLALIHHNIVGWTFVDQRGEPRVISPDTIEELLPWSKGGEAVSNRAATMYIDDAIGPLRDRLAATKQVLAGHRRKKSASSSRPASAGEPSPTGQ